MSRSAREHYGANAANSMYANVNDPPPAGAGGNLDFPVNPPLPALVHADHYFPAGFAYYNDVAPAAGAMLPPGKLPFPCALRVKGARENMRGVPPPARRAALAPVPYLKFQWLHTTAADLCELIPFSIARYGTTTTQAQKNGYIQVAGGPAATAEARAQNPLVPTIGMHRFEWKTNISAPGAVPAMNDFLRPRQLSTLRTRLLRDIENKLAHKLYYYQRLAFNVGYLLVQVPPPAAGNLPHLPLLTPYERLRRTLLQAALNCLVIRYTHVYALNRVHEVKDDGFTDPVPPPAPGAIKCECDAGNPCAAFPRAGEPPGAPRPCNCMTARRTARQRNAPAGAGFPGGVCACGLIDLDLKPLRF